MFRVVAGFWKVSSQCSSSILRFWSSQCTYAWLVLVSCGCYNKLLQIWWLKRAYVYSLTVLEARNLKPKCQQGCDPLKSSREDLSLPLVATGVSWLVAASVHLLGPFPALCVAVISQGLLHSVCWCSNFLHHMRTLVTGLEPTLIQGSHLNLIIPPKILFPDEVTFIDTEV